MRKIVRDITTKRVFYNFDNDAVVILDEVTGMKGPRLAVDMKPSTHEIVSDVPEPPFWWGGSMSYDDVTGWAMEDSSVIGLNFDDVKAGIKTEIYRRKTAIRSGDYTDSNGITVNVMDTLTMIDEAEKDPILLRKILSKNGMALELNPGQITQLGADLRAYLQDESETKGHDKVVLVDASTNFDDLPMNIHADWAA